MRYGMKLSTRLGWARSKDIPAMQYRSHAAQIDMAARCMARQKPITQELGDLVPTRARMGYQLSLAL